MQNRNTFILISMVSLAVLMIGILGCDDVRRNVNSENPDPLSLTGTILGKALDRCTGGPIAGVRVSVAGKSAVTTNANGEFVFEEVPVNADYTVNGGGTIWDRYTVLFDFTTYNANKPDSLMYPDYDHAVVDVAFVDLNDGDNGGSGGEESGSGADTPVEGLVSHVQIEIGKLNSAISGQLVNATTYDPVGNAVVYLKTVNGIGTLATVATTLADEFGVYAFNRVENGEMFVLEAYGSSQALYGVRELTVPCGQDFVTNPQDTARRILMSDRDNVAPFVTAISPANNEDVDPSAGINFVYDFSEPIKQTAYTNTSLPKGHNTIIDDINVNYNGLKKLLGVLPFTATWNITFDRLTVSIASSSLVGAGRYSITYAPGMAARLTDAKGNVLNNAATAIVGDFLNTEPINFTTRGSSTPPAAPVLRKDTLLIPATSVNWNGGSVRLKWTLDESQVHVKYTNIFKKIGDGPFDLLATNVRTVDTTLVIGSAELHTGGQTPRAAQAVHFYVQAISVNLVPGPFSNIISVVDQAKPTLTSALINNPAGSTDYDYIYILFSEPLAVAGAENSANYSISNNNGIPANAREATYLGFDSSFPGGTGFKVRLKVDNASVVAGEVLTVSGVTDLRGNTMDTNANTFTF